MTMISFQTSSEDTGEALFEPLQKAVAELLLRLRSENAVTDTRFDIQKLEALNADLKSVRTQLHAGLIDRLQATTLISRAVLKWIGRDELGSL